MKPDDGAGSRNLALGAADREVTFGSSPRRATSTHISQSAKSSASTAFSGSCLLDLASDAGQIPVESLVAIIFFRVPDRT